ncbi:hypothetical protein [Aquicella lusitana]|uniref:Uncharacterized protein n=1 Tax=Aquicella lusitana TaxID=254246 RepID=A0A370GZF5_9COXI|nr:hypothetical protein [Aquicella lusitana]RDI48676.1 hypothetical protein C8D86_102105 [Aquicella lusitana]VVC73947.1 hypothetical protein AQULUS_17080 [Aquicella lusitana]
MHGRFFDRAKNKLNSITSSIKDTYTKVTSVGPAIKETYTQTAALARVVSQSDDGAENLIQTWEGTSRFMDPANLTFFYRSADTRKAFYQGLWINLVLLGPVLGYEIFKYYFCEKVYDPEKAAEESYLGYTAYLAAAAANFVVTTCVILPQWGKMSANDIINNASLAKTISKEHANPNNTHCGCEDAAILFAGLASPTLYAIDMTAIFIASQMVPYGLGFYLMYLPRILIDGRALVEMTLTNKCTKHRQEVLAKNNAYSFGMGAAYQLSLDFIYWCIGYKSKFIYDPLSYIWFQAFILISLLSDKPLPGKKAGKDFLYFLHMALSSASNFFSSHLLSYLRKKRGGYDLLLMALPKEAELAETDQEEKRVIRNYLLSNMNKLPGKSPNAYVLVDEHIFYIHKVEKKCDIIAVEPSNLYTLKQQLKQESTWLLPEEHAKCLIDELSPEQLLTIVNATNHTGYIEWENLLKYAMNYPPVQLADYLMVSDNLRSYESAVRIPSVKLFLDLNGDAYRATIKEIQDKRHASWPYLVKSALNKYTPSGLKGTKALLEVILIDKLDVVLDQIQALLDAHEKYQKEIIEKIKIKKETLRQGIKVDAASDETKDAIKRAMEQSLFDPEQEGTLANSDNAIQEVVGSIVPICQTDILRVEDYEAKKRPQADVIQQRLIEPLVINGDYSEEKKSDTKTDKLKENALLEEDGWINLSQDNSPKLTARKRKGVVKQLQSIIGWSDTASTGYQRNNKFSASADQQLSKSKDLNSQSSQKVLPRQVLQ